jgi:hypothetical protein
MGAASSRCLASMRVRPAVAHSSSGKRRRIAVCTEGDPSCDFDFGPRSCTFLVSLCLGVDPDRDSSCSFAPADSLGVTALHSDGSLFDIENNQTLNATAQALLSAQAPGRCGPYVPVTVPLRAGTDGVLHKGARTYVLRGEFGGRHDRDRLALVCAPPPSSNP